MFKLLFQLYNFVYDAKAQNDKLDDPKRQMATSNIQVNEQDYHYRLTSASRGSDYTDSDPESDDLSNTGLGGESSGVFEDLSVEKTVCSWVFAR